LHREPLFAEKHLAAARKHIIDLFEILVFVVVRRLSPLQRVPGKSLQLLQAIALIWVVVSFSIAKTTPMHSAQMCDFGLYLAPIEYYIDANGEPQQIYGRGGILFGLANDRYFHATTVRYRINTNSSELPGVHFVSILALAAPP
jgi:hypothetical protein